jgi:hypothetical protein
MNALSAFLRDNPVIEDADTAREANEFCGRSERTMKDLEAARRLLVDPLNAQVSGINAIYRAVREPLLLALGELKNRLTCYVNAEEAKRRAEAERLRRAAEEKEAAARAAEFHEREAIGNAAVGELADVGGLIEQADAAFGDYQRAEHAAAIAARDVTVRMHSVLGGRARTLRTTEVLHVTEPQLALQVLWPFYQATIEDGLLKAARAYRKQHGKLPAGITREEVRSL